LKAVTILLVNPGMLAVSAVCLIPPFEFADFDLGQTRISRRCHCIDTPCSSALFSSTTLLVAAIPFFFLFEFYFCGRCLFCGCCLF
jgi:hypothetical protein